MARNYINEQLWAQYVQDLFIVTASYIDLPYKWNRSYNHA